MKPFPAEYELIEFFGVLPQLCDPGVPWVYNRVTFACERGADRLHVELEPASMVLRVRWTQDGVERLRLDLHRVAGLTLDRAEGQDVLVASFARSEVADLRLRIAPSVHLQWGDRER